MSNPTTNTKGQDMNDTQPKPTAAEVLVDHAPYTRDDMLDGCRCGWWWNDGQVRDRLATLAEFAQHQADMLAAAGLLATAEPHPVVDPMLRPGQAVAFVRWLAEHDAQVLRDAAEVHWPGACADDLRTRAARLAAGEQP